MRLEMFYYALGKTGASKTFLKNAVNLAVGWFGPVCSKQPQMRILTRHLFLSTMEDLTIVFRIFNNESSSETILIKL